MATQNTNLTLDYYKIKVFLYKYTPEFVRTPGSDTAGVSTQQRVDTYRIELDEKKYFSKYDLSEYISSYDFNQSINENTYDWSVTFHDPILTFEQINSVLKVEGDVKWDSARIRLLGQYEATQQDIGKEANFIADGKRKRGSQVKSFDTKTSPASAQLTRQDSDKVVAKGLRLSDLIQPYDVISVFLYKSKTPLEDLRGNISIDAESGLQIFTPVDGGVSGLTKKHLQTESILLSQVSVVDNNISTLFNTEFVGFALDKSWSTTTGEVDTVTVSGNGITRLFGSTRRIVKGSVFQKSLFQMNEASEAKEVASAFVNTFVGLKLHQIFQELFNSCYRFNFDVEKTSVTSLFGLSTIASPDIPTGSFCDISSLKVHNKTTTNMFSIPPFLLSLVLKRHGYKYRDLKDDSSVDTILTKSKTVKPVIMVSAAKFEGDEVVATQELVSEAPKPLHIQSSIETALAQSSSLQLRRGVFDPVYFSEELEDIKPYFKFFEKVLENYNPQLSTPYEIIDELKDKTFLEFIDHPSGYALIRQPQYNSTEDTIYSSSLDIVSTSYSTSVTSLVARQTIKYAADAIRNMPVTEFLAYTDGKLLLQFGQLEAAAEANPNFRGEKIGNDSQSFEKSRKSGIIAYARYLLRLRNASLFIGSITCGYDPRIVVGQTFYDENYSKFGYITSVTKTVSTGGAATMSFSLSYVRDAVTKGGVLQFQTLPTLLEVAQGFSEETLTQETNDKDQRRGLGDFDQETV